MIPNGSSFGAKLIYVSCVLTWGIYIYNRLCFCADWTTPHAQTHTIMQIKQSHTITPTSGPSNMCSKYTKVQPPVLWLQYYLIHALHCLPVYIFLILVGFPPDSHYQRLWRNWSNRSKLSLFTIIQQILTHSLWTTCSHEKHRWGCISIFRFLAMQDYTPSSKSDEKLYWNCSWWIARSSWARIYAIRVDMWGMYYVLSSFFERFIAYCPTSNKICCLW